MSDRHDLELVLDPGAPIVIVETSDESRHAFGEEPNLAHFVAELGKSRPSSVLMAARVAARHASAENPTVPVA
jgi:hypothetical protein